MCPLFLTRIFILCFILFVLFDAVSPPIVRIKPNSITAKVFGNETFFCFATGLGNLSFVWEYNDVVISVYSGMQRSSSITFDPVLPRQQGQYKCAVTSSYSQLSSHEFATLYVTGNNYHVYYFCYHVTVTPAPSFDSQTILQQVSSNASANTITVTIPQIDASSGPVRYV